MAESAAPAGGRVVDPDGTIHYDFDGHISAKGVDLPVSPAVSLPEDVPPANAISWLAADGGFVARVWGDTRGGLSLYGAGGILLNGVPADGFVHGDPGTRLTGIDSFSFGIAVDVAGYGGDYVDVPWPPLSDWVLLGYINSRAWGDHCTWGVTGGAPAGYFRIGFLAHDAGGDVDADFHYCFIGN
jgi:hypothetical protein